jgi:hypothetical protein
MVIIIITVIIITTQIAAITTSTSIPMVIPRVRVCIPTTMRLALDGERAQLTLPLRSDTIAVASMVVFNLVLQSPQTRPALLPLQMPDLLVSLLHPHHQRHDMVAVPQFPRSLMKIQYQTNVIKPGTMGVDVS